MKSTQKRFSGFLLSLLLACALIFPSDIFTVRAAETVLHVDASAVYTTIPDRSSGDPYKTIQDALSKALSGDTIQLESNVTFGTLATSSPCKIPAGMSLTLDLNGKTVTAVDGTAAASQFYLFENKGNFTLADSTGGGQITLSGSKLWDTNTESAVIMNMGGTVTITGGTIQDTGSNWTFAVDNLSSPWHSGRSSCTMTGGSLISSYSPIRLYNNAAGAICDLKITAGYISSLSTDSPIFLQEGAVHGNTTISISGGVFDAAELEEGLLPVIYWWNSPAAGTLSIFAVSGGTFRKNLTAVLNYWIDNTDTGTADYGILDVSGGTFEAAPVTTADQMTDTKRVSVKNALSDYILKNMDMTYSSGVDCYVLFGGYPPKITTESLPGGKLKDTYSQQLDAEGSKTIRWSIADGSLPNGLTLNEATGEISGVPAESGSWSFTVKAENSLGEDTRAYTISIPAPAAPTATPSEEKKAVWCVTFLDCRGNTVSVQWVSQNGNAAAPAGFGAYEGYTNVTSHRDLRPAGCNAQARKIVPDTDDHH